MKPRVRRRRSRKPILLLIVGLLVAGFAACGDEQHARLPERVDRVVLVTLDTLRADHMPSFGYPLDTMPFVEDLISRSVLFRRAFSQSATTKPAHSSMFTSLYPMQHGVLNNGLVLDTEFNTLAEMMRDAGFHTAGFVSTDVPLEGNVNQGFDVWDADPLQKGEGERKLYRPAEETVQLALDHVAELDPSERLFLWVHLYDPHKPMQPPEPYQRRVDQMIERYGAEQYRELLESRDIPTHPASLEIVRDYDAEILYVDSQLERLYAGLQERGLNADSVWVITSDHGQGLGAHDWFGHSKQIYNAQLHVPLIVHFPGLTAAGRVVDDRVAEHVDIPQTITELAGVEIGTQVAPMQGQSLVPHLRGERPRSPKRFAFAERSRYVDAGPNRQEKGNYEEGARYALQDLEFKYILFTEGEDEFYDLRVDPYELVNLIDSEEHADDRDQMLAVLVQMLEELASERQAEAVSEEDMERLRALGYIQ
ncbi:MAG: sulfatase [Acidobacteriota bacterium]